MKEDKSKLEKVTINASPDVRKGVFSNVVGVMLYENDLSYIDFFNVDRDGNESSNGVLSSRVYMDKEHLEKLAHTILDVLGKDGHNDQ